MVHAEYSSVEPFFAGIWCGTSKPLLKEYLEPFVVEMKSLMINGVIVNSHKIDVRFGIFICDTPARVLIKGIYTYSCGNTFCIFFSQKSANFILCLLKYFNVNNPLKIYIMMYSNFCRYCELQSHKWMSKVYGFRRIQYEVSLHFVSKIASTEKNK